MEFFEAVAKRHCHKAKFAKKPLPRESLRQIVEAGMAAPSAGNGQSPEFVIVDDAGLVAKLGEATGNAILASAPALIVVLTQPRIKETLDSRTECLIADFAVSSVSLQLAATALGYRCAWLDGPVQGAEKQAKIRSLLSLPDDRLVALIVPIGHPGEESARRVKKPFAQRASWNRYEVDRG